MFNCLLARILAGLEMSEPSCGVRQSRRLAQIKIKETLEVKQPEPKKKEKVKEEKLKKKVIEKVLKVNVLNIFISNFYM